MNHLSGFNEPDNPVEGAYTSLDNGSTATAVAVWPVLLSTGLRVGAPAVTDGGASWILDFMNKANAAGVRVDYVPVHYHRSYYNNNDPAGAANNLYNFLKTIHDATGRPIWLTEFNNGANRTTDADPTVDQNKNVRWRFRNRHLLPRRRAGGFHGLQGVHAPARGDSVIAGASAAVVVKSTANIFVIFHSSTAIRRTILDMG